MVKKIIIIGLIWCSGLLGSKITDSIYWMGSASSSAIGLATTAKTNSQDALYFNPAGLNTNKKSSINASYTSTYNTDFSNIGYIASSDLLSFGIGIHTSQSPDIEKTAFDESSNKISTSGHYQYTYSSLFLSSAIKIPYISFGHIGSSIHFHRMSISENILSGKSINLGIILEPISFISIGYTHHNVIPLYLTWVSKNKINTPPNTTIHKVESYGTLGIELNAIQMKSFKWSILADLDMDTIKATSTNGYSPLKIGTEIGFHPITIKAGYNHRFMSFGVTTSLNHIQFNYSFMLPKEKEMLDNRHAFGINYFL
ncbi:hypothetical protein DID73_01150 [Candidatus Marinamargulisbacteria bacterium SCGC AG-343-K17]|nr:hypothetical protein DID73_01150 [Candidatus Marinamargulisbacteria bacterium SCGC AG-343-K17]